MTPPHAASFGPIGVAEHVRGNGVGAALLLACLHDMRTTGYAYAVVGAVGAPEFFCRIAGATEIEGSTAGATMACCDPEPWRTRVTHDFRTLPCMSSHGDDARRLAP